MKAVYWLVPLLATAAVGTIAACGSSSADCAPCSDEGTGGEVAHDAGADGDSGIIIVDSGGDTDSPCTRTGEEVCDGLDNDCNGQVDDALDFTSPLHCGTCDTNCAALLANVSGPTCTLTGATDGSEPGTCGFAECAIDFWDSDGNPDNGCEYYCPDNPDGDPRTDDAASGCGIDDDCDGTADEDLSLCTDPANCGACGRGCEVAGVYATFRCETAAATGDACTTENTRCVVDTCESGHVDANGDAADGCEYACAPTGTEVCDGVDNDCDRLIDNADPDLEAAAGVGDPCFGGTSGACATAAHAGVNKCMGAQLVCCDTASNDALGTNPAFPVAGVRNGVCDGPRPPYVLHAGEEQETCNALDDDCDGAVDDSPVDAGGSCGNTLGACRPGQQVCVDGELTCQGSLDPSAELCNALDDDCDGVTDGTLSGSGVACTSDAGCASGQRCLQRGTGGKVCATPPAEAVGACEVPDATYPNPCRAGQLACQGGAVVCLGAIGPQGTDTCGEDTNCNGRLEGQPDFATDLTHCGDCTTDCTALYPNAVVTCSAGTCTPTDCEAGRVDCDDANPWDCDTECTPTGVETCNGLDDDCNCAVDDVAPANTPTPQQACGLPAEASLPDTKCRGIPVTCQDGRWECTFPTGYCGNAYPNYCLGVRDPCDDKDNDCDGNIDEENPEKGTQCASDDGLPLSHGACRQVSARRCVTNTFTTYCPAQKITANRANEVCDGRDNDCDGFVDELKTQRGSDPSYVAPSVVALGSTLWMFQYEATRPTAVTTTAGDGNGYWDPDLTPPGTVAEETLACSVASRIPWSNVTPAEASQTCHEIGGRLCTIDDWQTACFASHACYYGYGDLNDDGNYAECTTAGNYPSGTPSCNLAAAATDPEVWLTGAGASRGCYADWKTAGRLYDITGNLREIVLDEAASVASCNPESPEDTGCVFRVMGGAFESPEAGSTCDFDFYTVTSGSFMLYDAGFRCCFDANPG